MVVHAMACGFAQTPYGHYVSSIGGEAVLASEHDVDITTGLKAWRVPEDRQRLAAQASRRARRPRRAFCPGAHAVRRLCRYREVRPSRDRLCGTATIPQREEEYG
jgi:hypothetical protein